MSHDVVKGGQEDRVRTLCGLAAVFGERSTPKVDRIMAHRFWTGDDPQPSRSRSVRREPAGAQIIVLADRAPSGLEEGWGRGR